MKKILCYTALLLSVSQGLSAKTLLLDLMYLNDGESYRAAEQYFKDVDKLSSKYGVNLIEIKKSKTVLVPGAAKEVSGYVKWEVNQLEQLTEFFNSKQYAKQFVERRNKLFDMQKATVFIVE